MGELDTLSPDNRYAFNIGKLTGAADFARELMKSMNGQEALHLHNRLREFLESEAV